MAKPSKPQENSGNPRIVSLQQAALLLDRDRNTVSKWVAQGCPTISVGDKQIGKAWELDLSAVVRWLEDRAAADAASEGAGGESKEEAERRLKWAQARREELKEEEDARSVVRVDDVSDIVAQEYASVRSALQSVGPKMASRLIGQTEPTIIQATVDEAIRDALEGLRYDRPSS
jgi:phage terminase Nu1 subunit (DNA packaging protein)